jgi:dTDP-glucose 4,6-dehydratase
VKVLVTGAAGFLGSHLVERIIRRTDWEVVCLVTFRHNGRLANLMRFLEYNSSDLGKRLKIIYQDLRSPLHADTLREISDVNVIINAASLAQVDASIRDTEQFVLNNVASALTILEFARSHGNIERFVHVSTDEVYGPSQPATPTDYRPSSPYAASKAAQEAIAHAYRSFGIPITITNFSNMFGPRQSQLAFIPRVIRKLTYDERITVHTRADGSPAGRHYSYVRDVAEHLVKLIAGGSVPERVQLAGQAYVTNDDLVWAIAGIMRAEPRITHALGSSHRPGYDESYAELAGDEWLPSTLFSDALRQTVAWFESNPDWLRS